MSMRHIFGFDHIPVGPCVITDYFDTRLKYFTADNATAASSVAANGWLTSAGGSGFQAVIPQVIQDNPTHVVLGFRAKVFNGSTTVNSPITLYLNSTHTPIFTTAEMTAANLLAASGGVYISLDINLTTGVVRRWIDKTEIASATFPVATLKTAAWYFCINAYNNSYQSFQYRDIYIGDNADGVDVQVFGDRIVRSLPVKAAAGANWAAADGGSIVTAVNKAWVAGATDVTASNVTDNGALRVQFNTGAVTTDVDAVQVEVASSVASPTLSVKLAREGDATGKTTAGTGAIKWGARSPIYQLKSDGSKISATDLSSTNFDISGA